MRRGRFVLVVSGLVVGLLILEVGLRIALPASLVKRMVPDPVAGYRYLPHERALIYSYGEFLKVQTTNAHGDVDIERTVDKPPQVFRIAVVGDSMTEAAQVDQDERFTTLLEQQLNAWLDRQAPGRRVEVLNFGHAGNSTTQELLRYRTHVRRFRSDLVLLVFMPVNDIRENSLELDTTRPGFVEDHPYFRLDPTGALMRADRQSYENAVRHSARSLRGGGVRGLIRWFRDRSRLVDVLVWSYQGVQFRFKTPLSALDLDQFVPAIQQRAAWRRAWALTRAIVREFAGDVNRDGAAIHIAVASGPLESNQETRAFAFQQLRPSSPRGESSLYDWDLPNRLAEGMLRDLGMPFTNLWPALRSASQRGTRTNFTYDGHYTPVGHRVVAAKLLPALQEYVTVWLSGHR